MGTPLGLKERLVGKLLPGGSPEKIWVMRSEDLKQSFCAVGTFCDEEDTKPGMLECKGRSMGASGGMSGIDSESLLQMLAAISIAVSFNEVTEASIAFPDLRQAIRPEVKTGLVELGPDRVVLANPAFELVVRMIVRGRLEFNLDEICKKKMS